jgi:hypothetical protein
MQFHNSWVLLPLPVLGAFLWRRKKGAAGTGGEILGFFGGAALPLALLAPTLLNYGLARGSAGFTAVAMGFNWDNFKSFPTILARYLSFPCFEMPRFIGSGTGARVEFFKKALWLLPPGIFLTLLGWVQPFALLFLEWRKNGKHPEASVFRNLVALGFLWVWFCFWFTSSGPSSHMYYVFLPLTVVYSFHVWSRFTSRSGKVWAAACLAASLWFQSGFILQGLKGPSLYSDRPRVAKALQQKDYRVLGERRPGSFY